VKTQRTRQSATGHTRRRNESSLEGAGGSWTALLNERREPRGVKVLSCTLSLLQHQRRIDTLQRSPWRDAVGVGVPGIDECTVHADVQSRHCDGGDCVVQIISQ
jgi:hypothetical protein